MLLNARGWISKALEQKKKKKRQCALTQYGSTTLAPITAVYILILWRYKINLHCFKIFSLVFYYLRTSTLASMHARWNIFCVLLRRHTKSLTGCFPLSMDHFIHTHIPMSFFFFYSLLDAGIRKSARIRNEGVDEKLQEEGGIKRGRRTERMIYWWAKGWF